MKKLSQATKLTDFLHRFIYRQHTMNKTEPIGSRLLWEACYDRAASVSRQQNITSIKLTRTQLIVRYTHTHSLGETFIRKSGRNQRAKKHRYKLVTDKRV